jgi:hypothetical protein
MEVPMPVKNPDLLPLFEELKALAAPYAERFAARRDEPGYYDLWSEKEVVIEGRPRKEVFFAALIVQKSYVGFYFMPVYADSDLTALFGPELLATLKGKSCFHIRRLTPEIAAQMREALRAGYDLYVARGWVRDPA